MERKKEALIALPPVRTTTSSEQQSDCRQLAPLNKWQIERSCSPNPGYCQEELVNYWLHRNHIRVVERLPKMDPQVLTNRGTDVSKYFSFIHPPPFSFKVFSTEEKRSRETAHRKSQNGSSESSSPCPRLLRSQRSDQEMFLLNPVIRVGGGYRRLSWKVLDVLPSIGQYDPDFSPTYTCASCHANLPVTEKVTNSRGQLRTIVVTPKRCHKCGTPTPDWQAIAEKDLHESVLDTLQRGDSRFIVDHRRFDNSQVPRSTPKNNERVWTSSSPMDWHDDMESFRVHMSRQSQLNDDLQTSDQAFEQKRSESKGSVFMTEPGANIDQINEPPDVRSAWDDGSQQSEMTRELGNKEEDWVKEYETGSYLSDNDSFSDFEMIEDYDPKSGFTVRLRRRPFGGTEKTSYLIHGIQDEEETRGNSKGTRRKLGPLHKENKRRIQGNKISRKNKNGKNSDDKKRSKRYSHDINDNKAQTVKEKHQGNKTVGQTRSPRHSLARTESFFTVGLDRRDYVFSEEPVLVETEEEDDIILDPRTRFSEDSLSDSEFMTDSWGSDRLVSGAARRPPMPSPVDQDYPECSSSLSVSPAQNDGYVADSEENADLSSLQAQIQQARNDTKKSQRRKEEGLERRREKEEGLEPSRRKESKGKKEIAKEGPISQNSQEKDSQDRVPLNSGLWDSDWDSDFSLHVQPLSDLTLSSSEEENGTQRRPSNTESEQRIRRGSDKTSTDGLRRKEHRSGEKVVNTKIVNEGAIREVHISRSTEEGSPKEKKESRKIIVKPIPSLGPGSDSEDAAPRPIPRVVRGEDELSESDLNFFAQQFQSPYSRKIQENGFNGEGTVGCKGIHCYRCGALIPECQGLCLKCGTWCQRPGGPCSACRDICENCGKPKFRCSSVGERLEASEDEDGERSDSYDLQDELSVQQKLEAASSGEDHRSALRSQEKTGSQRNFNQSMVGDELNNDYQFDFQKKRDHKSRTPPERKKKDLNNVKRARRKRNDTSLNEEGEHNKKLVDEEGEEEEEALENERLTTSRESAETTPVEDLSLKPTAFPSKSIKKTKPSKTVISQKVVYRKKEKPTKSKRKSLQEQETDDKQNEDSLVASPTQATGHEEPGEELPPVGGEGTEVDERMIEESPGNEPVIEGNTVRNDVITKSTEGEKVENDKTVEMEKEEQKKVEGNKKNVVPKIRGVARVNAAFKERAELAKRLQSVLKEAISDVMGQADIKTRRDSTIDYLAQYRLVDRSHLEMYGRAFTLEDEDEDGIISYEQMLLALEGVSSIAGMSRKQLLFVLQVLELFPGSRITFKMFSVTTALCEKVNMLDDFVKTLVEELDLFELECKLDLFREMFFVTGDYSANFITADQLRIELKAGGLNQQQENHVIGHILQSTQSGEISFLDYMAYLPLFLSIHKNICNNALDMSRNKYQRGASTT